MSRLSPDVIWNQFELQDALNTEYRGVHRVVGSNVNILRVVIDSRNVQAGDLFVALKGERFDGHDFVKIALEKGAVAVVSRIPDGLQEHPSIFVVKDTFTALYDLARFARKRTKAKILGVTGSVGKTGTKEALRTALGACGKTYATEGNLNNHIGLPLSLANLPRDAAFGIFEMGMNHANEIAPLSALAKPDVAIITNVEAVHIEFFDSVEAIADAKAEIFTGMGKKSVAVLNEDNAHFARLRAAAAKQGCMVKSFGTGNADYKLESCRISETGMDIVASLAGTPVNYKIGAIGNHWGTTTVAVLAAVEAAGADIAKAAAALAYFREPVGRGRLQLIKMQHGDITLIDDSYNASPASMNAAFEKLRAIKEARPNAGRTVAVLGDMLELGAASQELHLGLMPALMNNQIDVVFTAGQFMKNLYDALPETMKGHAANDAASLAPHVVKALKPRDLVLVKGSNGSRMREVVKAIEQENLRAGKEDSLSEQVLNAFEDGANNPSHKQHT